MGLFKGQQPVRLSKRQPWKKRHASEINMVCNIVVKTAILLLLLIFAFYIVGPLNKPFGGW